MSSESTKDLRDEGVVFEGYRFAIDLESIVFANFQNNRCANIIKSQNDYHKFSRDQMFTLVERMNRRFDELLEQEIEFFRQIDECSSVYELSKLSYGI
jgi:bisphosphoglycerate-independent phosphoglycerate mutase (AlkP superfamily)